MTIIAVHGFDYGYDAHDNASAASLDALFAKMAAQPVVGFNWYSGTLGIGGELRALKDGEPDPYQDAYQKLAPAAAERLAATIGSMSRPTLICHSLGTRVALLAMQIAPGVERAIFFNGACLVRDVPPASYRPPILNFVCKSDVVLTALGSRFGGEEGPCIGSVGLESATNITVDDPAEQTLVLDKRGWAIQGDSHWSVYSWRGNWPMVRAFLGGDALTDLTAPINSAT